jgi:hypothetical protein
MMDKVPWLGLACGAVGGAFLVAALVIWVFERRR